MTQDIASIGFVVDTKGIEQGAVALDVLASKGAEVDKAVSQIDGAVSRAKKSLDTLGQAAKGGAGLGEVGKEAATAATGMDAVGKAAERSAVGVKKSADMFGLFGGAARAAAQEQQRLIGLIDNVKFTEAEQKHIKALTDKANQLRMTGDEYERYIMKSKGMSDAAQDIGGALRKQIDSLKGVSSGAESAGSAVMTLAKRVGAAAAALMSMSKLMGAAEEWTAMSNRLKLVTDGADSFVRAQKNIIDIANATRQPLAATAELYQRLAMNQQQLGLSGQGMADIVKTISQSMVVSGVSAQGASAALVQLGQAFASGTLRGDELNSVMEQAPALAQAIAAGMGKTVGELRALGKEGQITSAAVVGALQKQAAAVNEQFGKMAPTIGQAMSNVGNSFTVFVGQLDESLGLSKSLASAIDGLAKNFDTLAVAVGSLVAAGIAAWAASAIVGVGGVGAAIAAVAGGFMAATVAAVGFMAAIGPIGWTVLAIGAGVTALSAYREELTGAGDDAAGFGDIIGEVFGGASDEANKAANASKEASEHMVGGWQIAIKTVAGYLDAFSTAVVGTMAGVGSALETTAKAMADVYAKIFNWIIEKAESVINFVGDGVNKIAGAIGMSGVGRTTLGRVAGTGVGFGDIGQSFRDGFDSGASSYYSDAANDMFARIKDRRVSARTRGVVDANDADYSAGAVQYEKQLTEAAEERAKTMERLLGVNSKYRKELAEYQSQLARGVIKEHEYVQVVSKLATETYNASDAGKAAAEATRSRGKASDEAAKAAQREAEAYGSFISSVQSKIAAIDLEIAGGSKLTESQKLQLQLEKQIADGKMNASRAAQEATKASLAELSAKEAALKLQTEQNKAMKEGAKAYDAYVKTQQQQAVASAEKNDAMRLEIEAMGLSKRELLNLNRSRLDEQIVVLQAKHSQLTLAGARDDETKAIRDQIKALEERKNLLGQQFDKQAMLDAQQEITDTWVSIDRTAHDTFVNIFEDGAGTFKRLGQTLKSALLDMLYQLTVKRWIINIGASFGATGGIFAAGNAMAGQDGGSGIGNLAGSALNMAGGSIFGAGGLSGALMGGAGWLTGATTFTGALGAAGSLIGTGTMAGMGAGLAMGAGALLPVIGPLAALIGSGAFSRKHAQHNLEGTFGGASGFEGTWHDYYKGGLLRSSKTVDTPLDSATLNALRGAWKAQEAMVIDYAETLGLATDKIEGFTFKINLKLKDLGDPEAAGYMGKVWQMVNEAIATGSNEMAERILGTWTTTTREVEETIKTGFWDDETFTTVKKTVEETTYAASEYAREGERAIDTLTRLATSLQATNAAFDMLGLSLYEASLAGGDMASKLIDQMGGMDAFGAQVGAYWQNYYTEAERHAYMTVKMTEALAAAGLEMPTTVAGFRALVDAQDLTTDAGRAAFTALMSVNAAFTEVYGNADAAAGSIADLGEELAAMEPIVFGAASDLASVIEQGLLGTLTGAQLGEQMADVVMQGMYSAIAGGFSQQITALMVEGVLNPMIAAAMTGASMSAAVSQAAIDRVIQHAQAAAAAINAVLSDPGFQAAIQQVQAAVGSISVGIQRPEPIYDSYAAQNARALAAQREAERMADEAQRLAQQAAQEAQRAADEEARRQQGIMNERLGLTKQLLQLEGNTVLLRQIELEALDPSNRALQQRIWAIEDETAAAEKYKSALKDAQDFLGGFTKNIEEFIFKVSHAQADAQQSYQMAAAKFTAQMTLARGGDRDAMNGITGYADTLIGSIRRESTTGAEANLRIARVLGQLASLPKQISAEQLIVDAIVNANTSLETVLSTNFASLDANVDGLLTADELAASGLATNTQISALMARVDANGDGMISKQELANSRLSALNTAQGTTNTNLGNVTSAQNSTNSWLSQIQMADAGYSLSNINAINSSTSATVAAINKTNAQIGTFNRNYDNPVTAQFSADSPLYSIFKGIDETNTWLYKLHGLSTASIQYWIALMDNHRPVTVTSLNRTPANGSVFADGGFTGYGGKWQPAGVVHKGEVVWSQADVARWGGPGIVDALRQGAPGYADGGPVAVRVPQIYVPPVGRSNEETQALLREVLAELRAQRSDDRARHNSLAEPLQRMDRRGAKWDKDGLPAERTNEAIA